MFLEKKKNTTKPQTNLSLAVDGLFSVALQARAAEQVPVGAGRHLLEGVLAVAAAALDALARVRVLLLVQRRRQRLVLQLQGEGGAKISRSATAVHSSRTVHHDIVLAHKRAPPDRAITWIVLDCLF